MKTLLAFFMSLLCLRPALAQAPQPVYLEIRDDRYQHRFLEIVPVESHAWSESYAVTVVDKTTATMVKEPLTIQDLDRKNRVTTTKRLQCSGLPVFDPATRRLACNARIGTDSFCERNYSLATYPSKDGSIHHQLLLLEHKRYVQDSAHDKQTDVKLWKAPTAN